MRSPKPSCATSIRNSSKPSSISSWLQGHFPPGVTAYQVTAYHPGEQRMLEPTPKRLRPRPPRSCRGRFRNFQVTARVWPCAAPIEAPRRDAEKQNYPQGVRKKEGHNKTWSDGSLEVMFVQTFGWIPAQLQCKLHLLKPSGCSYCTAEIRGLSDYIVNRETGYLSGALPIFRG